MYLITYWETPFLSFCFVFIVLKKPFIYKERFFKNLNYFHDIIYFFIRSYAVCFAKSERRVPDSNIFLWIVASVADATDVNPNGIETLLANGVSTFPIKSKPVFTNGPKSLRKSLLDCPFSCSWVFDSFILAEELFAKALRNLKACELVNNKLWWELF